MLSSPNCNFFRGRHWLSVAVLGCLTLSAALGRAGGHPVPLSLPDRATPWTLSHESLQHRALEAEAKSRLVIGLKSDASDSRNKATANMDLYDVRFYDLVIDLNPSSNILTGTTTIQAEVTGASLSTMELYLSLDMYVPETRSGGGPVVYSRANSLLTITLDRTYTTGELVEVEIDYFGNPAGASFGWALYAGDPLVWTLSEPYGAREWWPCKDVNTDKADSVALHVTVPDDLVAVSNGTLEQVTVPSAGQKTYHWTERYPIATYLVAVTAHPFAFFSNTYVSALGDTMPLDYYVVPDHLSVAMTNYAVVGEMITAFAGLFGEYPFLNEKYGHVHFPWGGGMEHQTISSLRYDHYGEGLISHELGHQWFGDLVTCEDFSHIWINEGFATWCEAYWLEQSVGIARYHEEMAAAAYLGPGTIIVETPNSFGSIFDFNLSYNKASWVPHMLRHMVGEANFKAALQQLLANRGFGSATTADVQAVFESVSGLNLDAFFQQWIFGEFYPAYRLTWNTTPEGAQTRVMVKIEQTQVNTGPFTMPLDVQLSTNAGPLTFVVQNSQTEQWYDFLVDDPVLDVQLDPDNWVLRTVEYFGVSAVPGAAALAFELQTNVPNPFNPTTAVRFTLASAAEVRLDIYDVAGRLVQNLVAGSFAAGDHQVRWHGTDNDGRAVASGTYFARLQSGGQQQVRPLTLVR